MSVRIKDKLPKNEVNKALKQISRWIYKKMRLK